MPTHILRTYLLELRLAVVEIDFYLALDEEISTLFNNPLPQVVANAHAKMDKIG